MEAKIVSREDWLAARKAHLKSEKALTRMHDLVMEERRHLPWVRVEKDYRFQTTAGEKSTGLGLVIAKQVVEKHGGTITVSCRKGGGTDFTFSLPLPPPV